jgi:uncharacterized protein YycO
MKRFLALALVAATGCVAKHNIQVARPADPVVDDAVTKLWTAEIEAAAQDGDWILSRSYSGSGRLIVYATMGEDLSHASIYDAKRGMVIESVGSGVREIPLEELVQRNHYLILVRPQGLSAEQQALSVARARSKIGLPFDYTGAIGVDDPDRWYCSELVYWASQTAERTGANETVVTPADLMSYGEVVYWSGRRDDAQVMQVAQVRAERTRDEMLAAAH